MIHRLHLLREPTINEITHGALYRDGAWWLWTLEDAVRELPGQPVETWKVPKATAIPVGTYPVTITYSQRFRRPMPYVGNVPGFTGIRLHGGATIADTEGCPLVGKDRDATRLLRGLIASAELYEWLDTRMSRGDVVTLTILPPLTSEPSAAPPDASTDSLGLV